MKKFSFVIPLLSCLMLASCGTRTLTLSSFNGSKSVSVTTEIADDTTSREKGLMNRQKLGEGTAMLFAFPAPQILQFWMKDTLIPLEILFFDEQGSFVNALTMEPCTKNPCAIYKSAALAQYALEVPPGFREKNSIGIGWKIDEAFLKGIVAK